MVGRGVSTVQPTSRGMSAAAAAADLLLQGPSAQQLMLLKGSLILQDLKLRMSPIISIDS